MRTLSIFTRRRRCSHRAHNQLTLPLPLLFFFALLPTLNLAQPSQLQQPHPSLSALETTKPATKTPNPSLTSPSPQQCSIGLSKSWCPANQTCFITSTTFQCLPTTTTGWSITPHLNIAFLNPNSSTLLLPAGGTCLPLPVPVKNLTHVEILVLALKRHDAYYRTSTILISDDPTAILKGVSSCKNPYERCVNGYCVPVLVHGEVCEGNDECYNPPRAFNSTSYYDPNDKSEFEKPQQSTGDSEGEPFGLVCDYEPGELDKPPRCIDYIRVHLRPDTDQHLTPSSEHRKTLHWIFAVAVLVVIIAFVLLFMLWRKTHGSDSSGGVEGNMQPQMHQHQLYGPYSGDSENMTAEGGNGLHKKTTDFLSTNYLDNLGAVGGPAPRQRMGDRRGSASSQSSAHSHVSWSDTRRLSIAEKMAMDARERDRDQDHEFINRMSQSRRSGTFHRIEQLATSNGYGTVGIAGTNMTGIGATPLTVGPGRRSMSFDPMQVYPATTPSTAVASGGGGGGDGSGYGRVHRLQEPSPPPNTPENQLPETMPTQG